MSVLTQTEAQQRADDIRVFQLELGRLEHEGVLQLSAEQQSALTSHHQALLANYRDTFDIDLTSGSRQLSMGMRIASFLGALALAASVFFLFYRFWGTFSTVAQVVTLVLAPLVTFIGTIWLQGRDSTGYFTQLAAMVAFACFVLDISMLGQVFNITPSDKAFVVWGAFALLLAYSCNLRLLLLAAILCLAGFVAARVGTWSGMYWLDMGDSPENFFPAAALLALAAQFLPHKRFPGFAMTYRVSALLALLVPVLILAHWGEGSYLAFEPKRIEHGYQVAGFLLSAAAIWLGIRRHWPDVVNTGVTFFVIFLFTKFYDWWWETLPKYLFFFLVGLAAVLALVVLRKLRAPQSRGVQ
ncbi:DUF2157 domain-containing protein [Pseudomonas vanderleydeniana]|uniref:DUF2157 domain-containing protein n=1 Tax=Pseudomonas vanderleydeniana TaxID=2745495 RepID=A0A9E6TQ27_9PSED|nr:DUF2157 domain-containing protein [Pseudomonas vanderleydeniana]QXI26007.1 DUF2157 domain-containing protein [Pseudomonas vanderleydeniana]